MIIYKITKKNDKRVRNLRLKKETAVVLLVVNKQKGANRPENQPRVKQKSNGKKKMLKVKDLSVDSIFLELQHINIRWTRTGLLLLRELELQPIMERPFNPLLLLSYL